MDDKNLELFKQAINEGLSRRFDKISSSFTDEIVCSEGHELAMRSIVYGRASEKRALSPKTRRIIAILVAAALLLTGCSIFHKQIREAFRELYVAISSQNKNDKVQHIEEVYILKYIPEGFHLETESISDLEIYYEFINDNNDEISFSQYPSYNSSFAIDSETGYSKILDINGYEVYYRCTKASHSYIWFDKKYSLIICSDIELGSDEVALIIEGIYSD